MASAILAGLLRHGVEAASILVVEPVQAQRESLASRFGVQTAATADDRIRGAELVVWAVKPQIFGEAAAAALPHLGPSLHVSIAAGLPLEALCTLLQSRRVVRAMPNTSALVGAGVTGLVAAAGLSPEDRTRVETVLAATGKIFWVDSDERVDAITAVSGSGPAYVFHFLEAFQAAAEAVGFSPDTARELVLLTASGALEQARAGEAFGTLRERVTSKKGTTEAALGVLDAQATSAALRDAVRCAYQRAGELSRELSKV